MSDPRLRFSIQMPNATDRRSWLDKVRRAEDGGFYSISVPDHLGPSLPQLAPLPALAAAAAVTTSLRLATTVLDNDFRHPVMLAKEVATVDLLSEGRVDLGLGAGWLVEDYTSTGVATWDAPGVRVDRLFESIDLLRQLLAGGPVSFEGRFYQVDAFESFPAPVQHPVPLMLGGGGRRMLTYAARHAQIVSLIVRHHGDSDARLAAFEEQLAWVEEAGGRERDDLTVGIRILFGAVGAPGETRRAVAERVAGNGSRITADDVLASPFALVGDLPAVRDHLLGLHDRYGVSYFTVSEDLAWQVAPLVGELAG